MIKQSPKTFGQLVGYTPVFDEVVQCIDPLAALVFGKVWRYCQAEDQACYASTCRLGRELGLNPRTVVRKLEELVEANFLFKESRSGKPSVYRIQPATIHALAVTESHRTTDTKSQVPMTESPQKKEFKKQKNRGRSGKPSRKTPAAVNVFRKNAHRYPAKSWWEKLETEIGEIEVDLKIWGEVVFAWVGMGWNPTNVKGMLEHFRRKEIPGEAKPKEPAGFSAIRQHIGEKVDG